MYPCDHVRREQRRIFPLTRSAEDLLARRNVERHQGRAKRQHQHQITQRVAQPPARAVLRHLVVLQQHVVLDDAE